ncbi:uncharacterized protein PHALS_15268 [Plasmopara halstedii]|uniref:Uncharacterized protein n=1 Tax=Plasmopara halstedii TaxID=4781 RepID=A0A0P1B7H6_PLAHL|nr:uncharacterized protein PHALS_15268 [Plasmopara halstedii]CEG50306.1 hypothetical protein PHALS_15268 [Plasmopara halstedii]|eukprot:XP_024586675.1 hypothetical protein PHALS_15268 [Plasmopara halstedii]
MCVPEAMSHTQVEDEGSISELQGCTVIYVDEQVWLYDFCLSLQSRLRGLKDQSFTEKQSICPSRSRVECW